FITNMLRLSSWLTIAGLGMLAVLTVASIVIVMNTIRTAVYHRRQEIEVMKLVGATEWFVRGPFLLEGVLTGLIAAALALGRLIPPVRPSSRQGRTSKRRNPASTRSSRAWPTRRPRPSRRWL